MDRKWRRVREHEVMGGVCGGLAYWLGIPAWLVRMIWFMAVFGYGVGALLYVGLWIFMPVWDADPADYEEVTGS